MQRILVVDDDFAMRTALAESLESCGFEVEMAEDGAVAVKKFHKVGFALVVTDLRMPKMTGIDVLRAVKKVKPHTPVIIISAYGTVQDAVEAMKYGASEFLLKPFSLEELETKVKNVLRADKEDEIAGEQPLEKSQNWAIITQNERINAILGMLKSVAKSKSTVLIYGESGTGKELFARYIYTNSDRGKEPFVAVNCAAIPHNLLESEMFGYEKGAFTGALQRTPGKFELANGGTLLLDEISEMDMGLQAKLLRVLQESEVDRVGGRAPVPIDVRIIATTNADLLERVREKNFRHDLYYRLNVIPVKIPPLRERGNDIRLLIDHFLNKNSKLNRKSQPELTKEALAAMLSYPWPGNVRELENTIERAFLVSADGVIRAENLYLDNNGGTEMAPLAENRGGSAASSGTISDMEKKLIFDTLKAVAGNKSEAAKILGVSIRTIRNKLHEYGEAGSDD
ncbi:MAG: sigma-54 dependent transcriptional regulator [Syntrophales bacterium]|jgi:two-component system response regulator FlrC|nr:sigma-54 dependent transcriptional regulator [Syntrophales bacterium]